MVSPARLEAILSVIGGRIGIEVAGFAPDMPPPTDRQALIVTPNGIAIEPIHGSNSSSPSPP